MKVMNKKSLLIYILMIVSSVGYYSLKARDDKFIYVWVVFFVIATILQFIINNRIFKKSKTKLVYMDILFVLWVIFIPKIYLPYGLSRLIMAIIAAVFAYVFSIKKTYLLKSR